MKVARRGLLLVLRYPRLVGIDIPRYAVEIVNGCIKVFNLFT